MKFQLIIDPAAEEQVTVVAKRPSDLTDAIERLVGEEIELIGYKDKEGVRLELDEVCCFISQDDRVFALCREEKLQIKARLYQVEQMLPAGFVKINQSCIVNIKNIERFDAAVSGTLSVRLKNGYTDYVSRRQLKSVKERLGI